MEKKINSKSIYKGRIFEVEKHEVDVENYGRSERDIVKHNGASAILIGEGLTKFYLIKQFRYAVGDYVYEIPAGRIEENEDPKDAIIRESIEEIGIKPNNVEKIHTIYPSPGYSSEKIHIYFTKDYEKVERKLDEEENIEYELVSFHKAFNLINEGLIVDAKTIIAIYWYYKRVYSQERG